jgi:hypothetical protein
MSLSKSTDYENMLCTENGLPFSKIEERKPIISDNFDEPVKINKPDTERQIPYYLTYVCKLKTSGILWNRE